MLSASIDEMEISENQGGDADQDVDEEDQAPAPVEQLPLDQQPTDQRPTERCEPDGRTVDPEDSRMPGLRKQTRDDGKRRGGHRTGRQSLKTPEDDEHTRALSAPAQPRGPREAGQGG